MTAALPAASRCDERRLQRRGGGDRSEGQPAEQAVEPHAHAAAREALAAEQDDARVEAEVGAEPQRVAERGHGRHAVVGDEVDQPAAAVQQDAGARGTARWRARPAPTRRGPGTGRRRRGRRLQKSSCQARPAGPRPSVECATLATSALTPSADVATSARRRPPVIVFTGPCEGHERVVGASVRQVEYEPNAALMALRLRRGPRRWRPPGSACWRRACPWRCGRARGRWRARCRGCSATSSPVLPPASSSTTWCSRGERTPLPRRCRPLPLRCLAVGAQARGEGGGVGLGVAQGGHVEQRSQHRVADDARGHAHPAHAAVGPRKAHDARALRAARAQRVGARPALGERLARLRQAFAWRRELGAAAQLVAIEAEQLPGGAVGVDHLRVRSPGRAPPPRSRRARWRR